MNSFRILCFNAIAFVCLLMIIITSCGKKEVVVEPIDYGYSISINSPQNDIEFSASDTLFIYIDYKSETGEIVHFIGINLFEEGNPENSLYQFTSHQHEPEIFQLNDYFIIPSELTSDQYGSYILQASMWSHDQEFDTVYNEVKILVND